jgi:hypothetical protein
MHRRAACLSAALRPFPRFGINSFTPSPHSRLRFFFSDSYPSVDQHQSWLLCCRQTSFTTRPTVGMFSCITPLTNVDCVAQRQMGDFDMPVATKTASNDRKEETHRYSVLIGGTVASLIYAGDIRPSTQSSLRGQSQQDKQIPGCKTYPCSSVIIQRSSEPITRHQALPCPRCAGLEGDIW